MNEFDWAPLAEVQLIRLADENARLFGVGGVGRGAGEQWARGAKKVRPRERGTVCATVRPCRPWWGVGVTV